MRIASMHDQDNQPEDKSQTQRTSILTDEDYELMDEWDPPPDENTNGFTELSREEWIQMVTMMKGMISTKN
jgi:hypothetical protein